MIYCECILHLYGVIWCLGFIFKSFMPILIRIILAHVDVHLLEGCKENNMSWVAITYGMYMIYLHSNNGLSWTNISSAFVNVGEMDSLVEELIFHSIQYIIPIHTRSATIISLLSASGKIRTFLMDTMNRIVQTLCVLSGDRGFILVYGYQGDLKVTLLLVLRTYMVWRTYMASITTIAVIIVNEVQEEYVDVGYCFFT